MAEDSDPTIDWSRTTYEGATREAMRRWAELPLEEIIAAQEEMAEWARALGYPPPASAPTITADEQAAAPESSMAPNRQKK